MNRHQKRLKSLLQERSLRAFTEEEYKAADALINDVYQKQRAALKQSLAEELEYKISEQRKDALRSACESQLQSLKTAQRAWIQYRDHWEQLLLLHRPKNLNSDTEISLAIKTLLTQERTQELTFDPVSPE